MFRIHKTKEFINWLNNLKDTTAQTHIVTRIIRLEAGLFGNVKYFSGIGELKITHGKGYRVYFIKKGNEIIILLNGGNKATQQKDIEKALKMVKELKDGNYTF
ncbi:type II toxin-antitoxin system RelE/ParE family toxin [Bartonella sp. DGB1]|uniref:type II toxin-antitoxin system RelE/ParE family toxin n=1 Tax=Bartonella sp. DGB1 TaxID=3239807 RepID=UPI0035233AFB